MVMLGIWYFVSEVFVQGSPVVLLCTSCMYLHSFKGVSTALCRFAANGWPIDTSVRSLGLQVRELIIAAAHTGSVDADKMQGGLLDVYAALQIVPSTPGSSSSVPGSFGSTPEATPEPPNTFSNGSSAQSSGFGMAASPAPAATAAPLSAAQQAVSSAVQAAAVVTVNTIRNATKTIFGGSQPVTFASPGFGTVPADAPMQYNMGAAHIEEGGSRAAPAAAPMANSGLMPHDDVNAGPGGTPASKARKGM